MKEHVRKIFQPITLVILGFATRFFHFGFPNQIVFDELYYGQFALDYLKHSYFFDLHPPLAKLLAALMAYLGNLDPNFSYIAIGQTLSDPHYFFLRIIPTLMGALLPIIIYFLCREIGISKIASFFAGLVVIFENSLLVQTRFPLIDGQLIFWGFGGLLFYLCYKHHKKFYWLFLSSIFLGATISTKWSGLSYLAMPVVFELYLLIRQRNKSSLKNLAVLILIPLLIYVVTFKIHFELLTGPGKGDAFMSQEFQKKSFMSKFIELHEVMVDRNVTLTTANDYSSKWYTWPVMTRPMFYWQSELDPTDQKIHNKIYSLGNPFIYWICLGAVLFLLYEVIERSAFYKNKKFTIAVLLTGYFLNLLPYAFLSRVTFVYYYLGSLIFAIMILSLLIDSIKAQKKKIWTISLLLVLFIGSFLYFSPLSYGTRLPPDHENKLFWLKSWQ